MNADWKKVIKEAERQGWVVARTRKGLKLLPPDPGKQVVFIHQTPSEHRAMRNAIAEMRRQGLQWPPTGKGSR